MDGEVREEVKIIKTHLDEGPRGTETQASEE